MSKRTQDIQARQYEFPYHHVPQVKGDGTGLRIRMLNWGFEYIICSERIRELVVGESPSSVLDVGCGDGVLLGSLPGSITRRVGIDLNSRAIGFARAFSPEVDFRVQALEDVSESFDVVCAIEVLEHIPDGGVEGFLAALAARVSPGGALIISVPTVNLPLNPKHFRHYSRSILTEQTKSALNELPIERMEFYYRDTLADRLYRRLTQNVLIYGEIPLLRRLVFRHIRAKARTANEQTGLHLIGIFRRPTVRGGQS